MAPKPRRRPLSKASRAALQRMADQTHDSEWSRRWRAAIPHAVRAYARAVREAADVAIDKYSQALQRFADKSAKNGK